MTSCRASLYSVVPVEVALHVAEPEERLRADVVEARHAGEADLQRDRDVALGLLGAPPGGCVMTSTSGGTGFGYASMSSSLYAARPDDDDQQGRRRQDDERHPQRGGDDSLDHDWRSAGSGVQSFCESRMAPLTTTF